MKNKNLFAVIVLAGGWEVISIIMHMANLPAADMVPSWVTIFTKDLPGMAAFSGDGLKAADPGYIGAFQVILYNMFVTLKRVLLGFLFGGGLGVSMGILIGIQPVVRKIFYPVIKVLRNIPTLILISLFLVWFGGRETGIIVFISFSLWVIYCTSAIEAVGNFNPVQINFAKTLGAGPATIFLEIMLPMASPYLLDATRVAVGVCWAIALGGEFLIAQEGLGHLLILAKTYLMAGRMMIVLLCFIVLTMLGNMLISKAGKRLYRWMV